jgi:hypothetical protein
VTSYLGAAAFDALDRAQADIDEHVATTRAGRCAACGQVEPCDARQRAGAVFARYGSLPRRRPFLAVPRMALRRHA